MALRGIGLRLGAAGGLLVVAALGTQLTVDPAALEKAQVGALLRAASSELRCEPPYTTGCLTPDHLREVCRESLVTPRAKGRRRAVTVRAQVADDRVDVSLECGEQEVSLSAPRAEPTALLPAVVALLVFLLLGRALLGLGAGLLAASLLLGGIPPPSLHPLTGAPWTLAWGGLAAGVAGWLAPRLRRRDDLAVGIQFAAALLLGTAALTLWAGAAFSPAATSLADQGAQGDLATLLWRALPARRGTLAMLALAGLWLWRRRSLTPSSAPPLPLSPLALRAAGLLLLAWGLGVGSHALGAGVWAAQWLHSQFATADTLGWLPLAGGAAALLLSLGTGAPVLTMGALLPAVLVVAALDPATLDLNQARSVAMVVDGALLGALLCPWSAFTVLSAAMCRVDIAVHWRRQLPLTLAAGGLGLLFGPLCWGLGLADGAALVGMVLVVSWAARAGASPRPAATPGAERPIPVLAVSPEASAPPLGRALGATVLAAGILVCVVNFVIAPYQLSPPGAASRFYLSRHQSPQVLRDRLAQDPSILLFGTSRSAQLGAEHFGSPVLNLSMALYGFPAGVERFLDSLEDVHWAHTRAVFYLVDAHTLLDESDFYRRIDYASVPERSLGALRDFNGRKLFAAADTLAAWALGLSRSRFDSSGVAHLPPQRRIPLPRGDPARFSPPWTHDAAALQTLGRVAQRLRAHDVPVVFFEMPFSRAALRGMNAEDRERHLAGILEQVGPFVSLLWRPEIFGEGPEGFRDTTHVGNAALPRVAEILRDEDRRRAFTLRPGDAASHTRSLQEALRSSQPGAE